MMQPAGVISVCQDTWSRSHPPVRTILCMAVFIPQPFSPAAAELVSSGLLGGFQLPGSIEPSGGWGWVTGESFSYSNWDPGQPSDTGGNPNGEHQDLLIMWSGGTWNDITGPAFGSGSVSGYIVEYEVVPEPSICALIAVGSILAARARRLLGESKPALNE